MVRSAKQVVSLNDSGQVKNGDAGAPEGGQVSSVLGNGTGANQIDRLWSAEKAKGTQVVLAAATPKDLNLETFAGFDIGGGDGKDELGQPMVLADVVELRITNRGANAADIGGKAVTGWSGADTPFKDVTDKLTIQPGGTILLLAPDDGAGKAYIVGAGVGVLQLESLLGTELDIVISGRSV